MLVVFALLALTSSASAQSRFEIGAGATWTSGVDAGGSDALLTRNPATGSAPFVLFDTSSRVESSAGAALTVGVFVTSHLAIEATGEYARPVLRTTISSDAEAATGTTATSRVTSLVAGGSVRYYFGAARLTPFAFGGAGWLRQLDEDNVMLVTGPELHAGAGVSYRVDRHFALRVEGGVSVREKTIGFDEQRRTLPVFAASLLYRF